MARIIGKTKDGQEIRECVFDNLEVKALGDYELQMIGSTGAQDRDHEVISPKGWDISNYKKNPVVLEAHNYWAPAIGKAEVKKEDDKLIFDITFPEEGANPMADIYRKLYKGGFMRASSVGFIPKEWKDGQGDNEPRRTYIKQELLEISLVTVPCNPEALVGAKSGFQKGAISAKEFNSVVKGLGKTAIETVNTIEMTEETTKEINEFIKKLFDEIVSEAQVEVKEKETEVNKEKHYSETLLESQDEKSEIDISEKEIADAIKEGAKESADIANKKEE